MYWLSTENALAELRLYVDRGVDIGDMGSDRCDLTDVELQRAYGAFIDVLVGRCRSTDYE